MDYRQVLAYLRGVLKPAARGAEQERLFDRFTLVDFLNHSVKKDVPLLVSARKFSICSVLMPNERLKGNYARELLSWDMEEGSGGCSVKIKGATSPVMMAVAPPMDVTGHMMSYGEPIAYERVLRMGNAMSHYMELAQDFSLRHDLHYVQGRGVYCRLGASGELEDVVHVCTGKDLRLLSLSRDVLVTHLLQTDMSLVRLINAKVPAQFVGVEDCDSLSGPDDIVMSMDPSGQGICLRLSLHGGRRPSGRCDVWARGFHLMKVRGNVAAGTVHMQETGHKETGIRPGI